jgi:O-antigen biosynthesis protein
MGSYGKQVSVIIVNYNVRYFLENCLAAVFQAGRNLDIEVFVVDNNSVDGSISMLKEKFKHVHLIENKSNLGFSKANNQAIKLAKGEFVLLLNPDTVVEESTFEKCLSFMQMHPDAGALGVKMIDGKGNFLPESKRSLPTPTIAFYKVFGFSALFPKSKIFGRYHLGFLDKNHIHEVDILSGAFMFIRREVIDKVGYLDEDYFMYGEDIDYSYRINKAGFRNYYFPETTIIHYKGESTKKGSLNYVFTFYYAMIIFAKKNFPLRNARLFSIIIKFAIYFRAMLSIIRRSFNSLYLPAIEAIAIFSGYYFVLPYWEKHIFGNHGAYPSIYLQLVVPIYIFIWLVNIYFAGGYQRPSKLWNLIRGILTGTIIILIIYALLPVSLRFSRALLIIGAAWAILITFLLRYFIMLIFPKNLIIDLNRKKRLLIVGKDEECLRVLNLLKQTHVKYDLVGFVKPGVESISGNYIGNLHQIEEIVRVNAIDEIIFCSRDVSSGEIIQYMLGLSEARVDYKIAPQESFSIIGSNSVDSTGELYVLDFNLIAKSSNRRIKRLFDIVSALILLTLSPFLLFIFKHPQNFFLNSFHVLVGFRSWVGYFNSPGLTQLNLPPIKSGILNPASGKRSSFSVEQIDKLNLLYARDYKLINDLVILWRSFKYIDNRQSFNTNQTT